MKSSILIVAVLMVMSMTSCAVSENDPMEQVDNISSLTLSYGARSLADTDNTCNKLHLDELPAITADEASKILASIKNHSQSQKHSNVKENAHDNVCDIDITMDETVNSRYTFTIQLHMEKDSKGTVYYKSYEYDCSANTFMWYIKGFSFATDNTTGANKFEGPSNLYFKILDDGISYIQVPITIKGTYNAANNNAEFTYQL